MIEKTIKNLEDFWEFFELVRTQKASNKQKITISSIEAGAGLSCGMISRYKKMDYFLRFITYLLYVIIWILMCE